MPLSPEYELLRLAARSTLTAERAERFQEACSQTSDWSEVLTLASHHQLIPLLSAHVHSYAEEAVPAEVRDALPEYARSRAFFVLFLSSEMARVGAALDAAEVEYLVLKGPSLTAAYGSPAKRPFVDNDLYIKRKDYDRVADVLTEAGFRTADRDAIRQAGYLLIHGEASFGRRVGTLVSTVDLHTDVVPIGFSYRASFDALYNRSRSIPIAGHSVQVLSWEDLFLALSVNALKDQWNRLRLATDLAEVGGQVTDWQGLEAIARRHRSLRALYTGLLVATDEVGANFPEEIVSRARSDRQAADISREIRTHLRTVHRDRVMSGTARARLIFRTQDGSLGRLRYLAYVALRRLTEGMIDPEGKEARVAREAAADS